MLRSAVWATQVDTIRWFCAPSLLEMLLGQLGLPKGRGEHAQVAVRGAVGGDHVADHSRRRGGPGLR